MRLSDAPQGSDLRIRTVDLDIGVVLRLREMGVRPGAVIHVAQCVAGGARVLALGATRLAIDRETARRIDTVAVTS